MLLRKTIDIAASQTGTTVLDPGSGAGLEIARLTLLCSAAGNIEVFIDTNADPNRVMYASVAVGVPVVMDWTTAAPDDRPKGAKTKILKYTTGLTITGRLLVEYVLNPNAPA